MLILVESGTTFWNLRPLRPPWGHLGSPGLPDGSQMPPRCLQMPPRCFQMMLPDASQIQMFPRCVPDVSRCLQMPPRCIQMFPDPSQMMMLLMITMMTMMMMMMSMVTVNNDDNDDASMPRCLPNDASPMMPTHWYCCTMPPLCILKSAGGLGLTLGSCISDNLLYPIHVFLHVLPCSFEATSLFLKFLYIIAFSPSISSIPHPVLQRSYISWNYPSMSLHACCFSFICSYTSCCYPSVSFLRFIVFSQCPRIPLGFLTFLKGHLFPFRLFIVFSHHATFPCPSMSMLCPCCQLRFNSLSCCHCSQYVPMFDPCPLSAFPFRWAFVLYP